MVPYINVLYYIFGIMSTLPEGFQQQPGKQPLEIILNRHNLV